MGHINHEREEEKKAVNKTAHKLYIEIEADGSLLKASIQEAMEMENYVHKPNQKKAPWQSL